MAASTTNEFYLRTFPYLDAKWLRADLQSALRSTEILSILWNNLVKDNELICASTANIIATAINSAGHIAYMQNSGKYYCGAEKLTCNCCTGYCRPTSDCNCMSCKKLDASDSVSKRIGMNGAAVAGDFFEQNAILSSDCILESWLWSHCPSDTQKADCIRTLINEQRDLSMQAAGHSLFAMHLKQRLFIYHRYLIALSRLEITTMDKNALATRKSLLQTDQLKRNELKQQLIQKSINTDNSKLRFPSTNAVDRATLGLARVGTRAALNFSFAFLRRAWRSGEDTELCSELLLEALDALQGLPEASLFHSDQVSSLWLEVLERSLKFLRQVVIGDLIAEGRCSVPRADRHIALNLLLELESQKGTLSASLEAILLLLTLWEKEKDTDDNRELQLPQNTAAPLVGILRRYESINGGSISDSSTNSRVFDCNSPSPTESFLRFYRLPEQETSNIDMKQAAVVIISHLDRLTKPFLSNGNFRPKVNGQSQKPQIYTLGAISATSEGLGFTTETFSANQMFDNNYVGAQYRPSALYEGSDKITVIDTMVCSEKQMLLLTESGEVFAVDTTDLVHCDTSASDTESQCKQLDGFGNVPVLAIAAHCEGRHFLALNTEHHVYAWGLGEGGRLGLNDTLPRETPTKIQSLADKFIMQIFCGAAYSAAVTISGELYTWGRGTFGSLGHGSSDDKLIPCLVQALAGHSVVDVALGSGDSHSLCVTDEGLVFAWGDGDFGKLGMGTCSGSALPKQVEGLPMISRIYSGSQFSVALSCDGQIYTWGKRYGGRLGHSAIDAALTSIEGPSEYCHIPKKVGALDGKQVVDVAVGSAHCLAMTSSGELYGWGRNDFQQICNESICQEPIIPTPILISSADFRISGMLCGSAYSVLFSNTSITDIELRIPYIVDLNESTFKFLDQLLNIASVVVNTATSETIRHPPTQEFECTSVACLNLLRLQFHALIANKISPKTVGLTEGCRLLTSLKTKVLQLAGGFNVLNTIQTAAQRTLQTSWSILLPSACERAQTLTSLLPSEPGASTAGVRFMTDLLVSSLMAEESLQTALKQAINSEPEDTSNGHNLPLLHLIKQLLRNNSALTQARLTQLLVNGPYCKAYDDCNIKTSEPLSPSLDLLHRFQRLLLSYIHQASSLDELSGAEALVGKYIHHLVTSCIVTLSKAYEIASQGKENSVAEILAADVSDTLLYELLVGLVLLHRDKPMILLQSFDWSNTFIPLLGILDDLNRITCDSEIQDNDNMGWPGIICRNSNIPFQTDEETILVRQSDLENHILDDGKWILMNGFVYDIADYQSDNIATNELLFNNIGKDLSAEMSNVQHRTAFDYITTHLKVGKYSYNDIDEKQTNHPKLLITHLESERTLSFLLGFRATLLQKATELQPAEVQCKNLLNSPVFSGGLQVLQPSNPFDEEKGEARSSTSTAGSTPTEASGKIHTEVTRPKYWPHTLITHRVDSLLTGLGEGRLMDPLVSTWITIAERFCKENNLIWHQDFPSEHPISELERLLTAIFIRHQSLGPLVLAVVDRELSTGSSNISKFPEPVADVIKLVHQTKWTLIKTRQQLNRSYKEVCAPMIDKCRFLLYEVRPVISPGQCAFLRNKILHQEPRFKSLARKIIGELRASKKLMDSAKPEDILNVTIQNQFTVVKDSSSDNLCSSVNENDKNVVKDNITTENYNSKVLHTTGAVVVPQIPAIDDNSEDLLKDINLFDSNCIADRKPTAPNEGNAAEDESKTPTNDPIRKSNQKSQFEIDDLFIDDVIAKLSENCIIKKSAALIDPPKIMSLIVDFILQDSCDVETLRRAMYCQVQRYQIRKQGIIMFAQLLHITDLLDAVQYNLVSGYLGLFLEKSKQHYLETVVNDLNMITTFQKTDLILTQAKIIEWAIGELKKFINQEHIYTKQKSNSSSSGKDSSNFGTYVFLKKLPRARFLLSVFGVLCKNMGPNEINLVVNSGALSGILSLLKQTGNDILPTRNNNERSYVFEDSIVKKCTKLNLTGSELAKLMKSGTRVVRGTDWKWGDQDGPSGEGRIISEVGDDGWVRVEWDNGATNSYRMGKENQYDLRLADNISTLVTPETETEDDVSLMEVQLSGNSHPTKLLKNAGITMLKIIAVSVGQFGDQIDKSAIANISTMFRSLLSSSEIGYLNFGMEHWNTIGFLRAISKSKRLTKYLTTPAWLKLYIEILNRPIACEQDVYKKVQCVQLLALTLIHWEESENKFVEKLVEKLFDCLGKIALFCPNDLPILQSCSDVKSKVLLTAGHTGTVGAELVLLLRQLHPLPLWNSAINSYLAQKLCIAADLINENLGELEHSMSKSNMDLEKVYVMAALNFIGGCDPRPRIGLLLQSDANSYDATISTFTAKGKALISYFNSKNFPETKKISIAAATTSADILPFNLNRLSLNEMLLNSLAVLIYGPGEWKQNSESKVDIHLLRAQQLHLASLNATFAMFKHQSSLRKILLQRCPGTSSYSSNESINETDCVANNQIELTEEQTRNENKPLAGGPSDTKSSTDEKSNSNHDDMKNENELEENADDEKLHVTNELLVHTILSRATQTNPLKSIYSYAELSLAALNLSQQLATNLYTENDLPPCYAGAGIQSSKALPPIQPTLIHGVPIYNDGILDDLQTPSSEGSNLPGASGMNVVVGGEKAKKCTMDDMHVNLVMKMGFNRKTVDLAVRTLKQQGVMPVVGRIVEWIIEHPDECSSINDSGRWNDEHESDTDSISTNDTMEGSSSVNDNQPKYACRDDFRSADQYAIYVRGLVVPGMLVRCCQDFEEIRKGDIGTVLKVDTEGLHDLNVQVDWRIHGAHYWMCFVHIELLEPPKQPEANVSYMDTQQQTIMIGSHVRNRMNVSTPRYKWGSVPRESIGVVTSINDNGDITVDFPQQFNWTGHVSEMELVCQYCPAANEQNNDQIQSPADGDIIEDWSRCIRSLTVSSNESSAKYLLDRSVNYWQSSSTQNTGSGKHWIRLELHENVLIHLLSITVNGTDCSHMPSLVVVRVGDSVETLKDFSWVSIKPSDVNVTLLSSIRQYYQWIEIVIKQCRNNGIQCKVHGINIIGRRKQTDLDLMLMNASFLASENDINCEPSSSTSYSYPDERNTSEQAECKVMVWGLNDKEQLAGLKGSKVKCPTFSSTLSQLRPIHIAGGSKSLFIVSQDGKVYACGEGTNGRLGLGHNFNVSSPRKLPILSQYVVKKVAVHSGGKHAMALTLDGKVFSWGEGEDGKLGHNNRITLDKPKLIEALRSKRVRDIACGSSHSAAITSSGELYTWGLGEYGRLGHGDNCTQLKPKLVQALIGQRVVQIACGSRDAQTLALTEDGSVFSWGDGDFGKLGRGGSEGCFIPHQVERLNDVGVIQIECGAQFSLALTKSGEVWTWGKGDYYRLGHGSDQHVRKPTPVQGLRAKKVIHVAVGALHCLAVTDTGQVYAWGDNDHGQQGTGTTTVNKKPCLVVGLDNVFVNRVACGSSHSVAWSLPQCAAEEDKKEPVAFAVLKDPLGGSGLGIYSGESQPTSTTLKSKSKPSLTEILLSLESYAARQAALSYVLNAMSIIQARQCIIAALTSHTQVTLSPAEKTADCEDYFHDLGSVMNNNVLENGGEAPADIATIAQEAATPDSVNGMLATVPPVAGPISAFHSLNGSMSLSASISSVNNTNQRHSKMSASISVMAATMTQPDEIINENSCSEADDFTMLLGEAEAKSLLELLKLSVNGRTGAVNTAQAIANTLIALGMNTPAISIMILETCITELEDLCTSRHFLGKLPKPVVQETSHPYIDDITLVGHVRIPNAEALRLEFDQQCSTEKRNDPLIIMDGSGRVIATRSGREYAQWAQEIRIPGEEMRWKFTSDSSVNGWGWRFWVHAVMPPSFLQESGSDRSILSQPSMDLVMALLGSNLEPPNQNILLRIAAALSSCAQLSSLTTPQRIWALKKLRQILKSKHAPKPIDPLLTPFLSPLIPLLLKQYEYEESQVRGGVHLMHSEYFKTLAALACDMQLDTMVPTSDVHKWSWFRRYCSAVRVAECLINRTPLPASFCNEVRKKLAEMCPHNLPSLSSTAANVSSAMNMSMISIGSNNSLIGQLSSNSVPSIFNLACNDSIYSTLSGENATGRSSSGEKSVFELAFSNQPQSFLHEDNNIFRAQHDRQLLQWLNRRPEDWALSWGGASTIYGWGHNHRGQLGGLEGGRIKTPTPCESLSLLRPIYISGGEQTLYAVTPDGKMFATGYGAGGRLGIGGTDSISTPILVESLQHVFIKKVAVNSGGKHCLALTADGEVYSWGEGEDGKLGHNNRLNYDRPKLIEALSGIGVVDIACGSAHSACITSSGHVLTWGKGRYGRLGHGDSEDQLRPKLVEALVGYRAIDIACGSGDAQTLCISDDDNVWSWGDGDYGKLGRGGSEGCKYPMKIESLAGLGVVKVECGSQFSVALTRSGAVYTWGKGDYHRLGHGSVDHVRRPKKVAALQGKKIVSIATGSLHCVACSDQGEVFTWGDNDEGQLGDGTVSAIQRPRLVTALQGKHIVKVTCGSAHTLALSTTQMSDGVRAPPIPPLEYDFVRDLPPESLHSRLVLLHHFSELLCPCLAMLPITGPLSLAALKDLLVYSIKEAAFRKVIQQTMVRDKQHGPVFELNRIQVKRSRSKSNGGLAGVDGMKSVFGQMVQKLPLLNQEALYLPHRVWKVKFVGESVDDCGGGFSESIAEMCDELQNGSVPLLIQTPNGRGEAGANRDCFLLDPTLSTVLQMNMFRFLGVLMGIAVRTGSPLSLNLAEPVWRQLTGEELCPSDLTEVDRDYIASLICIRDMDDDPKVLQSLDLPFSTPSAKGHEVQLSSRYNRITANNRHEYVRLALIHRLHEFDEQVKAVRDGMSKVIPVPLLSLFSASQLQAMVCGSPEIPLGLLKSVATYKGIEANAPLVQWFWEVMEEFSNQERSLFLRFVWGRTRLPRTIADFRGRDFVLQVLDKYHPPDHFLPESYTCFFLLKMPRYSCKAILLEKLKYAIYFCKSIDTDEYARVAMVEPTEPTASENNSDIESEVSEEM